MRLLYVVTMTVVLVCVTSANMIATEHSSLRASILSEVRYKNCLDAGLSLETIVVDCNDQRLRVGGGSGLWPNLDVAIKLGEGYCFLDHRTRPYSAISIRRPEDQCLIRKYPICRRDGDCLRYFPDGATCVLRRPSGSGRKRCRPTVGFGDGYKCLPWSKQCRQGLRCSLSGYCERK